MRLLVWVSLLYLVAFHLAIVHSHVAGASDEAVRSAVIPVTSDGRIVAFSLSPDHSTLAASADDGTLAVIDVALRSSRVLRKPMKQGVVVHSVAFSSDGRTMVAGDNKSTVTWWDTLQWKMMHSICVPNEGWGIHDVALSKTGQTVGVLSHNGDVFLCRNGQLQADRIHHSDNYDAVALSDDGSQLIASDHLWHCTLLDTATGTIRNRFDATPSDPITGGVVRFGSNVWLSSDGSRLVAAWGHRLLRYKKGPDARARVSTLHGSIWEPRRYNLASGGQTLVTAGSKVEVWDVKSSKLLHTLDWCSDIRAVDVSADRRVVAAGDAMGAVKIWVIDSPEE